MSQPNMKKQYRAELKRLRAEKRNTLRERRAFVAAMKKTRPASWRSPDRCRRF